jgi:hypothetical protein
MYTDNNTHLGYQREERNTAESYKSKTFLRDMAKDHLEKCMVVFQRR